MFLLAFPRLCVINNRKRQEYKNMGMYNDLKFYNFDFSLVPLGFVCLLSIYDADSTYLYG